MSSMGEEADKTQEARRAHSSSVSLPWSLAQGAMDPGGTQEASSMQKVQNYTRDPLVGLHQPKHHKAAAIRALPAQASPIPGCSTP